MPSPGESTLSGRLISRCGGRSAGAGVARAAPSGASGPPGRLLADGAAGAECTRRGRAWGGPGPSLLVSRHQGRNPRGSLRPGACVGGDLLQGPASADRSRPPRVGPTGGGRPRRSIDVLDQQPGFLSAVLRAADAGERVPAVQLAAVQPERGVPLLQRIGEGMPRPSWPVVASRYVPWSQMITVPPPYSPCGIVPSKSRCSSGWSSVGVAKRLSCPVRRTP